MQLNSGTLLQGGKYKIEKSLGQGGFGITYLAEQTNLNRKVCIKEFFMKDYSERAETQEDPEKTVRLEAGTFSTAKVVGDFRNKFIKEAINIAKLNHPGIVRIHDYFEESGTAYYVMDYIEGENLLNIVKRKGPLSENRAIFYIRQVADALAYLHGQKLMHLDVKPSNIIIRDSDDKAILIDFGTAKCYDSEGTQTSTAPPIGISAGYAPIEMMKVGGVSTFSPETDVYSLGATLYSLVTGQNPPDASERMEMIMEGEKFKFPKQISTSLANAIESAMQARKQRPKSIEEFVEILKGEQATSKIVRPPIEKTLIDDEVKASVKTVLNSLIGGASRRIDNAQLEDAITSTIYIGPASIQTVFDVILISPGKAKLQMVKAVKELTGLGLKEAKELVDKAPNAIIKESISKYEAEQFKAFFDDLGAIVEITPSNPKARVMTEKKNPTKPTFFDMLFFD